MWGVGRRCRDIQHDHDGCMAAGGHARALYLARGGKPRARGPESYLYYTLWVKVARFGMGFICGGLGWDLYTEVWDGIYIRRFKLRIRSAWVKLSGEKGSRMIILALLIGWMCVGFSAFDAAARAYGPIFR